MAFDLTWPKVAALATVQAGAQTMIGLLTGSATDGTVVNWAHAGYVTSISSLVAFLGLVVAYKAPGKAVTAAVSVPMAVHQFSVSDADEARKR